MAFSNDLFISYAHIDNEALSADQEGWVSGFHRSLEVRLAQLRGVKPRIWRDPKLAGNDFFADTIGEQFLDLAAIVTILSPRYVRSEWCLRELETFFSTSERTGGPRLGGKARIFKVVKTPVPLEQHPSTIQPLLGYDFYTFDPETGRTRELNRHSGPELERLYWAKLDDLAQDLAQLLDLADSAGTTAASTTAVDQAAASAAVAERGVVYLAETSYDLKSEREALRRDLVQKGFRALPDQPLPMVAEELEPFVARCLEGASASIHLLGKNYGIVPEGARESIVALQHELAAARAQTGGLRRLVWIPPGLEVEDDRQQILLDRVRSDSRAQASTEILETHLEDFKETLYRALEPEPAAKPAENGGGPRSVYLICDQRDLDAVRPLEDFLFDRGLEVVVPVFAGEPAQVREDHVENLRECAGVILYYGLAGELWLRAKLRELQKVGGYGRKEPIRARAIYLGDPLTPEKGRLRTHEAMVIEATTGLDPLRLEPFLKQLAV